MRAAFAVLLLASTTAARAAEWKSELFHCAATLPDGPGWQIIEPPHLPGITTLVVTQHLGRRAAFGINIVEKAPGTDLADPAVRNTIENLLRQSSYQVIGHSKLKIGSLDWLQYPVRSGSGPQQAAGVVRFTSGGGYIFALSMLRGGGQDAAQDLELQRTAASFRVLAGAAPLPAPAVAPTPALAARSTEPSPKEPAAAATEPAPPRPPAETKQAEGGQDLRLVWFGAGGLVLLVLLFRIIGGGKKTRP